MNKKMIVWEKWIDPLNSNIDEVEYPGYFDSESINDIEFLSDDPEIESYIDDEKQQDSKSRSMSYNPTRIASTAHGFVVLTEHSFASKHFDFWTLHYNRDISEEIVSEIEKCDGVETVDAITRYRVRIGFNRILLAAEGFNLTEIKRGVEQAIGRIDTEAPCGYEDRLDKKIKNLPKETKQKIRDLVTNIDTEINKWIIYVLPNGEVSKFETGKYNKTLIDSQKALFEQAIKMVGGKIISSSDIDK